MVHSLWRRLALPQNPASIPHIQRQPKITPDSQMDFSPGTTKVAAIPQKLLIARNSYSKVHQIGRTERVLCAAACARACIDARSGASVTNSEGAEFLDDCAEFCAEAPIARNNQEAPLINVFADQRGVAEPPAVLPRPLAKEKRVFLV